MYKRPISDYLFSSPITRTCNVWNSNPSQYLPWRIEILRAVINYCAYTWTVCAQFQFTEYPKTCVMYLTSADYGLYFNINDRYFIQLHICTQGNWRNTRVQECLPEKPATKIRSLNLTCPFYGALQPKSNQTRKQKYCEMRQTNAINIASHTGYTDDTTDPLWDYYLTVCHQQQHNNHMIFN